LRALSIILAVVGVGVATLLVGWFGVGRVADSLSSVGWPGFALFTSVQVALFVLLGIAWWVVVPPHAARPLRVFVWGRAVRDSSGNLLPFAQIGGFALGARAVTLHGVGWAAATATTMVDVTMEFAAELGFALIGLFVLMLRAPDSALVIPIALGVGLAILGAAGFVWLQHGAAGLLRALGTRIVGDRLGGATDRLGRFQSELDAAYARPLRLLLAAILHLMGWVLTGVGSWIAYRLLGADIDLLTALGIEALLSAAVSLAFAVPVAAGVQEAAYAGLGTAFGLPPEISLSVSLLRRARDLAVGVPVLLLWQFLEMRRLRAGAAD
jgi:glycosyltransferase 2 family protein